MKALFQRILSIRIIRYGLVGGVGIPVNDLALFLFTYLLGLIAWSKSAVLFGHVVSPRDVFIYPIASACAFEVSNIVNFTLNQFFTYREQLQHIHGREWIRRAVKGQLTSLSAMLLSYAVGLLLFYVFHVSEYIANPAGIIVAFIYNFFISNKLVFKPVAPATPSDESLNHAEATPKNA